MRDNTAVSQVPNSHYESLTDIEIESHNTDLPAYTPPVHPSSTHTPSERVEYAISLDGSHGRPFLTLKVRSRAPNLPVLMEGEPVTGTVELDLQKPESIKTVIISFKGLIVISGVDSKTFLNLSETLWQSSMGDPRAPSTTANPFADKLTGNYSWPFSFTLPPKIQLTENEAHDIGLSVNEGLPPSLADRGWHSFINYQITVNIERNGFFHANSELSTLVGYSPATRPDPPSRLRALAYQENTPIMGPDADSEGWKTFPEIHLKGMLFKTVETSVSISLALPIPLAYARGTAFPCALILKSSNKQAVDLLSVPKAPIVRMRRKLETMIGESSVGSALQTTDGDQVPFAKANWHPAEVHEANGLHTCTILGELSLPHNLVPSFVFGQFDCKYVVDVYPPEAAGFEPASDKRLFRTNVTVTSLLAHGPRPRAYLPPGYHAAEPIVSTKDTHRMFKSDGFL